MSIANPSPSGLLAGQYPRPGQLQTGEYITALSHGLPSVLTLTLNELRVHPIYLEVATSISQITVETTAGSAGTLRHVVYSDNGRCYPDKLKIDTGTGPSAPSGWKNNALSPVVLPRGIYWIGTVIQGAAACNVRGLPGPVSPQVFSTILPAAGARQAGWAMTGVTGAASATFTATRTPVTVAPQMYLLKG